MIYYGFFFSKDQSLNKRAFSDLTVFNEVDSFKPIDASNIDWLSETKIFQLPNARSTVVFYSFQSIGVLGWLVITINTLHYFVWLLVTFMLLKVFNR